MHQVSHGSHGKWMFCREWNMLRTASPYKRSAPLTGSDASTLESFMGSRQNLLRANVKLRRSFIPPLLPAILFLSFSLPFHGDCRAVIHKIRLRSSQLKSNANDAALLYFYFPLLVFRLFFVLLYIFSFFPRFVWSSNACWYGRAAGISIFERRNTTENWNVVERAHEILMNSRGNEYCK